jgi:GNAT superfamily N-acetyltransferase
MISSCLLKPVKTPADWQAYHSIRCRILFEANGVVYNDNHPDERVDGNHPMLLVDGDKAVGTVRIDLNGERQLAIIRLVGIEAGLQGRGYGRQLLRLADEFALAHGCTVNSRLEAVEFYCKNGFEPGIWDEKQVPKDGKQLRKKLAHRRSSPRDAL